MFCKKRCSLRNGALRNFAKFTGKHLCQSLFFNKVADLRSATLLKKRLWHRCFPVNFAKFLKTPFLQNTSGRLVLTQSTGIYICYIPARDKPESNKILGKRLLMPHRKFKSHVVFLFMI